MRYYNLLALLVLAGVLYLTEGCTATVHDGTVTVKPSYCEIIRAAYLSRDEQLNCGHRVLSCPGLVEVNGIGDGVTVTTQCVNRIQAVDTCDGLKASLEACGHLGLQ